MDKQYDIIVIGAGHAGVEAALAAVQLGNRVLLVTLNLDAVAFMACNPSIGGTAKGHLVREIDALGGVMGIAADHNLLQLKMLNVGKGAAVQSLRGQADKISYHLYIKNLLLQTKDLTLIQGEASEILTNDGRFAGVRMASGAVYHACACVIACGVYLNSSIVIGEFRKNTGPSGFESATALTNSLLQLGLEIRRFKTGTPARINRHSVDFSKMEIQQGDSQIYPFSFMTKGYIKNRMHCYLAYTNQKTHDIIRKNLHRSPMYNGSIKGVGPRYCPSIEDKVMRFADKERHQIFIEPESLQSDELYVQGMSSSMPHDVQEEMYRSIEGMEHVEILRYAYAIEYDCLDATALSASLMIKEVPGLFSAGQINGTSGYEEAAAQGLIAGINASRFLQDKEPLVLGREEAYIGVLIDDLVTKGTNEPYRMMTARAEYRLRLRQENADLRLTPIATQLGMATPARKRLFENKLKKRAQLISLLDQVVSPKAYGKLFAAKGEPESGAGLTYRDMLKRTRISAKDLIGTFEIFQNADLRIFEELETEIKYEGYLAKQESQIRETKKLENKLIPKDIDYLGLHGLRLEARQKLDRMRPENLGQASRISGVSPADITVLLVYLERRVSHA